MDRLKKLREEIDRIDLKLLELLNRRAELVKEIIKEKEKRNMDIFDPTRERKIIEKLMKSNKGPLEKSDIEMFMETVFKIFRGMKKQIKIAYLGPEGTFTHQAALKTFGEKSIYIPCKTIEQVFIEVEKDRADYGVVPIENSTEGIVTHTIDMFMESELKIISEVFLSIHHYLLSREKSLKKIKKIYSHPQAISQCQKWIEENLPGVKIIETESTSKAAKRVKREKYSGAIGSAISAKIYKLNILAEKIEDFRENITRFLVIGKEIPERSGNDKTSILFSIKDRVGALHDMLLPFKKEGINLTRLESRPSKKKAWDYVFFVDFIGHKDDENVKRALKELEENSVFLKILGSYPKGG